MVVRRGSWGASAARAPMVAPRRRLRRIAAALAGPLPPAAPVAKEEAKPEEEEGWESAA
eukprot:COSAG04_NODE_5041_length_1768_cov_2.168364_3_plen_58_part_01